MNTDNNLIANAIIGILRHFLTAGSAGMVADGVLTGDQQKTVISAVLMVLPIALSVYDKMHANNKQKAAVANAAE